MGLDTFCAHAAKRLRQQSTHRHSEVFYNLIRYLVRLRREGTLDNDDFSELVKMASAAFIEAEVAVRVEMVLEEKVKQVLKSKISTDYLLGLWK